MPSLPRLPDLSGLASPAGLLGSLTGGESAYEAAERARELSDAGRLVALEHAPAADAARSMGELELAMSCIAAEGLGPIVELIVLPEALGDGIDRLAAAARDLRIALTLGLGQRSDLRATLALHERLQSSFSVGLTLPAAWRGTEERCRTATGRIRIVKGADDFGIPAAERFSHDLEVDKAFVRAARGLIPRAAEGVRPSLATQDGRIIAIAQSLAARARLPKGSIEFAMHLGRGGGLQERLVGAGEAVRVIVPFGPGRLERLVAGVLERPGGIAGAVRSIVGS